MIGNDHWTIELERLGMKEAGDELARLALCCRPPYAICVQGKWGSGKTSLMRYAMAKLGGMPLRATLSTESKPLAELPSDLEECWTGLNQQAEAFIAGEMKRILDEKYPEPTPLIVPIWFNPWQHQRHDLPAVGLLREIRSQFTTLLKLENWGERLTRNAVEAALPLLGKLASAISVYQGSADLGMLGETAARYPEVRAAQKERDFENQSDAQRLNLLFEQAVRRLLAIEGEPPLATGRKEGYHVVQRRIVVFIDDLDRCGEEQTLHLLEAIKLYLQTSHCVFVVGMDSSATRRAVAKVLGQGAGVAREYLEKLFQATFPVPLPLGDLAYVEQLLDYCGLDEGRSGCSPKALAEKILRLVEPNPRKLKTFVSGLAAGWGLCGLRELPDPTPLLLLSYLRVVHPDVFRLLTYDPAQAARLHRVQERTLQPDADPVDLFLQRQFHHAFSHISDKEEGRAQVVSDLIERLDQHKGDQQFLLLWKEWSGQMTGEQVVNELRPLLHRVAA